MQTKVTISANICEIKQLANAIVKEYKTNASKQIRIAIKKPKHYAF